MTLIPLRGRVAVLAAAGLAGCYTYAPIEITRARPGGSVRVGVTSAAAVRVAPLLGRADSRTLIGTVVDVGADTLVVELPTAAQAGIAGSAVSLYQRVSIAKAEIVEIETRTLDRTRTALAAAAVAFVGGSAVAAALRSSPSSGRAPSPTSTETKLLGWRLHF